MKDRNLLGVAGLALLVWASFWGVVIYVAWHFIRRFW